MAQRALLTTSSWLLLSRRSPAFVSECHSAVLHTRRPSLRPSPASYQVALPLQYGSVRGYAKKKSKGKGASSTALEEEPKPSSSGTKKGKGKFIEAGDIDADGEVGLFDLGALEKTMDESIVKLRVSLKTTVARVGKVTPDLLDDVKVEEAGTRRPLAEFASVSVKDGKDLLVTLYDESFAKAVSAALYASPLSLTPQHYSATSLLVPIPRANWEKRQALVRQASELCENARVGVRSARSKGQKEIKKDVGDGVVGKEDGRTDGKKLDAATKTRIDEIDAIFDKAKSVLMDE